jgi:upstream activation factor subunit UAF30
MRTRTPEKKASAGKTNALQKPLQPSEELAAVVGSNPLSRGQVVSKMWEYIRSHDLQNPNNRREILADDKLRGGLRQRQGDHVRDEQTSPAI